MEIIEEEAFLAWKEDITQEFPGKGKALFQVSALLRFFFDCQLGLVFVFLVSILNGPLSNLNVSKSMPVSNDTSSS
jgi:hypothetical protein